MMSSIGEKNKKEGLNPFCKKYIKVFYMINSDKLIEKQKEWYLKNRDELIRKRKI